MAEWGCKIEPDSKVSVSKVEVLGRVSSLSFCAKNNSILCGTILNGTHVFHLSSDTRSTGATTNISSRQIETFSTDVTGSQPCLSSCFLNDSARIVLGSSEGDLVVLDRSAHKKCNQYSLGETVSVRSVAAVPTYPNAVLASVDTGAQLIDTETAACLASFPSPVARTVGALVIDSFTYAVANYDGKVLLFDARNGSVPQCILSIPDQICSFNMCPGTGTVCAGTAGGRVFRLRCGVNDVSREEAFATGTTRSPIRSLAVSHQTVAAGDVAGRLSIIDLSDAGNPTMSWSSQDVCGGGHDEGPSDSQRALNHSNTETTATTFSNGALWTSFSAHGSECSHLVTMQFH